MMKIVLAAGCAGFCLTTAVALAGGFVLVRQQDRQFDRQEMTVEAGEIVRFTNDDPFLHQIYVESPGFSFDSNEQSPGDATDVTFDRPGSYEVLCGIHPLMSLRVEVVD